MTKTKSKGIIFTSGEMRANLAGLKTQHRVVIKPQPPKAANTVVIEEDDYAHAFGAIGRYGNWKVKTPFKPGDVFYAKEPWKTCDGGYVPGILFSDGSQIFPEFENLESIPNDWQDFQRNRSPNSMPAWAARYWGIVKSVRVERLQEIIPADITKEGIKPDWELFNQKTIGEEGWEEPEEFIEECEDECDYINCGNDLVESREHREWQRDRMRMALRWTFESNWQKTNGKSQPWESNPWVWIYEYERTERP